MAVIGIAYESKGSTMSGRNEGGAIRGMMWMIVISLLLFWLPVIGPFIAGIIGGKKSGGVGNAILAVFLPGIFLGIFLFFFATMLSGLPVIGAMAGAAGGLTLCFAQIGPLLLGGIIGGFLAY